MEKKKNTPQKLFITIGLLMLICIGYSLWNITQSRYKEFKSITKEALKEALVQEMDAQPAIGSYIGHIGEIRPWESLPDTIVSEWKNAEGRFQFSLPSSELRNNIAGTEKGIDGSICTIHSVKLFKNPMDADTLYQRWLHLLPSSLRAEVELRMNYTDLYGKQTTTHVPDIDLSAHLDSLCMWSVGSWCELKVSAYAALPDWWQLLAWWEWLLPIVSLACLVLLYGFRKPLYRVSNRLFIREKVVEKVVTLVREVEKVKEIEKVVYVKSVAPNQGIKTYQIGDGLYFQAQSGKLWNDKLEKTLSPQTSALLQTFLEAKDYKVEKQYLIDKFWPKRVNDPNHTLHNAISRLRKETEGLINIISDAQGYQLEIP